VNACRNAALLKAGEKPSVRKGSRAFRRDTVRALFGIVQGGGVAVTDPPQDGDDRVHIIGHLPADGITTPFCISLRSTAAVRGTSLSARNTNGDTMILAGGCLDYPLDPHLDLPSSELVAWRH
jgi:hypothetical protein